MSVQSDMQAVQKHMQAKQYARALKAAQSAARSASNSPFPVNAAGIALSAMGRPAEAIRSFQKALQIQSDFLDARKNLIQTLVLIGQFKPALAACDQIGPEGAKDRSVWSLRAQALMGLGREKDALGAASKAVELASDAPGGYKLRADILMRSGRIRDAILDYEAALQIEPQDAVTLTNMSLPFARLLRSDDALKAVQRAVEIDPEYLPAQVRLAAQHMEMGNTDAAIAQYRAILETDPKNPNALERLAEILPANEAKDLERPIRAALKTAQRKTEARAGLLYGLARVLSSAQKEADADKALASANAEMARVLPYDPDADTATTDAILSRFPTVSPSASPTDGPMPIFVLGLPRSGTTLVETVLGAHPEIAPLGELGTAGFLLRELIETDAPFDADKIAEFLQEDRRLLPDLPAGSTAYIDKMPENYRLIGFLKTAYPGCKIIHVKRDLRDVALSMWKSHFSGTALSYTYDLAAMAHRFKLYARTMAHWHRVLPGEILDVRYEDLVTDLGRETRRMAEFCGVAWVDGMLRPEDSTQQVLTLSATQLRRAVHTRSIGQWTHRQAALRPFLTLMDEADLV